MRIVRLFPEGLEWWTHVAQAFRPARAEDGRAEALRYVIGASDHATFD
jgi:hypothetical protein